MSDKPTEFREQLLSVQSVTPTLRETYQKELDVLLHPPFTARRRVAGIVLLILFAAAAVALLRNFFVYRPGPMLFVGWATLTIAFGWVAFVIARSLWRSRIDTKTSFSVASVLTGASGMLTVVALMRGLSAANDPK